MFSHQVAIWRLPQALRFCGGLFSYVLEFEEQKERRTEDAELYGWTLRRKGEKAKKKGSRKLAS